MWFVSHVSRGEACVASLSSASWLQSDTMKKKLNHGYAKKRSVQVAEEKDSDKIEAPTSKFNSLDDEDQGFGGWLKSPDGLENMKLFVIANSIVMLTTLVYPHIQSTFTIIYDMVYGPDSSY